MSKSGCLALATIVFLGITISTWLMRSDPVLFAFEEKGDPLESNLIFIQNPFRDRAAERAAENFLNDLKIYDWNKAFRSLESSPDFLLETQKTESELRIVDWYMNKRSDSLNQASLEYWVTRGLIDEEETWESPVWLELKKTQKGWRVIGYETHY